VLGEMAYTTHQGGGRGFRGTTICRKGGIREEPHARWGTETDVTMGVVFWGELEGELRWEKKKRGSGNWSMEKPCGAWEQEESDGGGGGRGEMDLGPDLRTHSVRESAGQPVYTGELGVSEKRRCLWWGLGRWAGGAKEIPLKLGVDGDGGEKRGT